MGRFELGAGADLADIGFQVVNFNDFFTPGVYASPVFGFPPQVAQLADGGWRIRLTAVKNQRDIFMSVGQTGGYAFTHLGRLERADGAAFAAHDAEDILEAFRQFLSFARGASCSLPVRWGVGADGAIVWEWWGSQPVDPWKGRDTWFDEHHGNLQLKVPLTFPAKLVNLSAFTATNGWPTACEALAEIRHGYVHSNKKRRQVVLSAPNLATFEAWQLSLWY